MNISSPPRKNEEDNNASDMNDNASINCDDDSTSSSHFASPQGKEESTGTNGNNNGSSEDDANAFYESTEFYDGLKDAMKAARIKKARAVLLEQRNEFVQDGRDTAWIDSKMQDLESFVEEHKSELDQLLMKDGEGGMDIDTANKKRGRDETTTNEEVGNSMKR